MVTRRVMGVAAHFKCQLMTRRRLGGSRPCRLERVEVLPLTEAMSEVAGGLPNKAEDWGRGGVHTSVNGSASGARPSPWALEDHATICVASVSEPKSPSKTKTFCETGRSFPYNSQWWRPLHRPCCQLKPLGCGDGCQNGGEAVLRHVNASWRSNVHDRDVESTSIRAAYA